MGRNDGTEVVLSVEDLAAHIASPDVRGVFDAILGQGAIPEEVYREVMAVHRPALQQAYRAYFAEHHVEAIVFPTALLPSVDLDGQQVPTTYIHNTDPGSNAGLPGLSVPIGLTAYDLPVASLGNIPTAASWPLA